MTDILWITSHTYSAKCLNSHLTWGVWVPSSGWTYWKWVRCPGTLKVLKLGAFILLRKAKPAVRVGHWNASPASRSCSRALWWHSAGTAALLPSLGEGFPARREQRVCVLLPGGAVAPRGSVHPCLGCPAEQHSSPCGALRAQLLSQAQEPGAACCHCAFPMAAFLQLHSGATLQNGAKSALQIIHPNFLSEGWEWLDLLCNQKDYLSVYCVKGVDKSMFFFLFHSSFLNLTGRVVHTILQLY